MESPYIDQFVDQSNSRTPSRQDDSGRSCPVPHWIALCKNGDVPKTSDGGAKNRDVPENSGNHLHHHLPGGKGKEFTSRTLSQPDKFFCAQSRTPEDRPEGPPIQFSMIRNNHLAKRIRPAEDHMASLLPLENKTRFLENFQTFTAGKGRKFDPTAPR